MGDFSSAWGGGEKPRIKPDESVISVDASMLEELPPELRDALSSLYGEQEQRRVRERNAMERAYQSEQVSALVDSGGWVEVLTDPELDRAQLAASRDFQGKGWSEEPDAWRWREQEEGAPPWDSPAVHQFYDDLYSLGESSSHQYREKGTRILVNHRDREHPFQLYEDYQEFIDGVARETSFIYMGDFWVPPNGFLTSKRNAMTSIGGFCIDIDRVDDEKGQHFPAWTVVNALLRAFDKHPEARPNYLMLSGTGIQLWYVFGRQVPLLSAKKSPRRDKLGRLLKLMYAWFDAELPPNRCKVDVPCATINHAFRAPGSPTKHHYPTRLFAYGGRGRAMIDPLALSEFFGGDLRPYDLEDWDQQDYERIRAERDAAGNGRGSKASAKQVAYIEKLHAMGCLGDDVLEAAAAMTVADADAAIKAGETVFTRRRQYTAIKTATGRVVPRRPRARGVYDATLARLQVETPIGSRYWALFGLAGLGWNCCVPKSQVKRDMTGLLETEWASKKSTDGKPLSKEDVEAAMRGYNELGALRTRDQLENLLKWSYGPPAKRNGRKQKDHLERARKLQEFDYPNGEWRHVPPTKAEKIRAYAVEHPEENHSQIARALGVSRPTVIKWLKTDGSGENGNR